MRSTLQAPRAVLLGSCVGPNGSSKVHQSVKSRLDSVVASACQNFGGLVCGPLQWEDEQHWRLRLLEPGPSLRIAVYLRAGLRAGCDDSHNGLDAKVAIGISEDAIHMPGLEDLHEDPATAVAIKVFSLMRKELLTLDDPSGNIRFRQALRAICVLVDVLVAGWTPRQALAVTGALCGMTQDAIRGMWDPPLKNQSVVARHLDRAGWEAVRSAIEFMENWAYKHQAQR